MMSEIWKFEWPVAGSDTFITTMPKDAEIIHVAAQRDVPCIWARVSMPENRVMLEDSRHFRLVATGERFDAEGMQHLGTVLLQGGEYVFHIYEYEREARS